MSDIDVVAERFTIPARQETLPKKQRRYTVAYKLRIIELADACVAPGELGALLRREALYHSTLKDFRKQKACGDLDSKAGDKRVSRAAAPDAQTLKQLAVAERENRRLRRELEKARLLLDLQKKVAELFGATLEAEE